jgi:glucose-1-phosphate cytidylyltransferase
MVEIGNKPILWHIMKHYAHHGCDDFYVALGYMGESIKGYFLDRYNLNGNLTIDFARGMVRREDAETENWTVNLIETGLHTLTGGRLLRMKRWLDDGTFMLTYGDGVSNVDITELLAFHKSHGKLATMSAVRPPARFGGLILDGDSVRDFTEKPVAGEGWINGGFLVFEPGIFDFLTGDNCSLEASALDQVAAQGQLAAYRHDDFWQCMDTLRDRNYLESLWQSGDAPLKTWEQDTEARLQLIPQSKVA